MATSEKKNAKNQEESVDKKKKTTKKAVKKSTAKKAASKKKATKKASRKKAATKKKSTTKKRASKKSSRTRSKKDDAKNKAALEHDELSLDDDLGDDDYDGESNGDKDDDLIKDSGSTIFSGTKYKRAVAKAPELREGRVKAKAKIKSPEEMERIRLTSLPSRVTLPDGYQPSEDEEYMNAHQLEYFRQKLLKWRDDLVEESQQTIQHLRDEARDVSDEAERATRETENAFELRTRDRYRKLLSKIDKTLKRIDEGDYGYCEESGEEIGLARLEARPIASMTIEAQERWEHRKKQRGD